jgi:drug/metabolite transporter (DMT)-like permease
MLQADSARNRLTGIALVSTCYVLFTFLDGSAKWLVASVPVVVVVWLRFLMHAVFASALLFPLRGKALIRTRHWRWHLLRSVMFVVMTGLNFWALQYLQLAVTSSITFVVPIFTALIAPPMLGDKIDSGRWAAILAGFAGVLIIVRPWGASFHPAMLLALSNALLYAMFNLMTRRLAAYDSPETIQYLPALGAAILLTPFAIAGWESLHGWLEWGLVCLMGALGGLGHYLLAVAHRYAPATVIAPFLYQQVLYMALFGYLVFGVIPDPAVGIGAAIVIACGLYLFARERARF